MFSRRILRIIRDFNGIFEDFKDFWGFLRILVDSQDVLWKFLQLIRI